MKSFRIVLGLAVSSICLYLAARQIDFLAVKSNLKNINLFWLLLSTIGILVSQWVRGARWARLLKPINEVSNEKSFQIYSIGNLANLLIPLRGGDVLRAWFMAGSLSVRKSLILATVVTERLIDLIFFGLLLGLSLTLYSLPEWVTLSGIILVSGSLFLILILVLLKVDLLSLNALWRFIGILFPHQMALRFQEITAGFLAGLAPLKSSREYITFLLETVVMWAAQGLFFYLLFYSFNFQTEYNLGINASLLILALTTVAVTVPSSPGYVGTLHLMALLSLEICGVPSAQAFSYALIAHATFIGVTILLGIYGLIGTRIQARTLFKAPS
jgi:uncharacterized protein (TIRG00374 family)